MRIQRFLDLGHRPTRKERYKINGSRGNSRRAACYERSEVVEVEVGQCAPSSSCLCCVRFRRLCLMTTTASTLGMAPPTTTKRNQKRRESPSNTGESESRRLIKLTTGNGSCVMATAGWIGCCFRVSYRATLSTETISRTRASRRDPRVERNNRHARRLLMRNWTPTRNGPRISSPKRNCWVSFEMCASDP